MTLTTGPVKKVAGGDIDGVLPKHCSRSYLYNPTAVPLGLMPGFRRREDRNRERDHPEELSDEFYLAPILSTDITSV
jgi:hypothetical protein